MKRIFIISLSIVMVTLLSNINAQEKKSADGKGIRAGWQSSFIAIDGNDLNESSNGFYAGIFKNNNIGVSILNLDTGLEYYQINGETSTNNLTADLKLHYLSIPIALRVNLGPLYAMAGVNGALKLGGKYTLNGNDIGAGDISTFDAGGHLGVGVKVLKFGCFFHGIFSQPG